MTSKICNRCNKIINPGDLFYQLGIKIFADFDGVINIREKKFDMKKEFDKIKSLPEDLLEEEVFREFYFTLCPRCKEIYCANPLHLPLDNVSMK
jgi:phage FluMu protein Com